MFIEAATIGRHRHHHAAHQAIVTTTHAAPRTRCFARHRAPVQPRQFS